MLGPTLHFKGELYGEEDLEFQGQLEGSIEHTRSLSIGKEGGVTGNIKAKFVIVEGRVDGDIYASESVSIRASAKVKGNIFAPRVGIADGANFSGSIDMNHKGAAAATRPATVPGRAQRSCGGASADEGCGLISAGRQQLCRRRQLSNLRGQSAQGFLRAVRGLVSQQHDRDSRFRIKVAHARESRSAARIAQAASVRRLPDDPVESHALAFDPGDATWAGARASPTHRAPPTATTHIAADPPRCSAASRTQIASAP